MDRIPEGVYELGKFLLVSKSVADTRVIQKLYPRYGEPTYEFRPTNVHVRMDLARSWYREWHHAWSDLREGSEDVSTPRSEEQVATISDDTNPEVTEAWEDV